jgi:hypothetical protein
MNERLRELAEQALKQPDTDKDGLTVFDNDELEKFAELIVRECIDIVSPYAVRMDDFDGGHPIADLKKHFGVEE